MTSDLKSVLDELADTKGKSEIALRMLLELLVILVEKDILSKEDINSFKERIKT